MEFSSPQKIRDLNTFEKCLLIYSIRKENKELACSLARQIRAESPKENQSEIKRLFNIALNLKSIEETKVEAKVIATTSTSSNARIMGRSGGGRGRPMKMLKKCAAPMAPMAMMASRGPLPPPPPPPSKMSLATNSLFGIDKGMADRINAKAQ